MREGCVSLRVHATRCSTRPAWPRGSRWRKGRCADLPALKHHHRHEGDHHGGIERDVVLTNLAARGGWQGITMQGMSRSQ